MLETQLNHIDISQIIEKIREEADKLSLSNPRSNQDCSKDMLHSNLDGLFLEYNLWSGQTPLPRKDLYTIDELLRYQDLEFIRKACWVFFNREPNEEEISQFLPLLRERQNSKIEILWIYRNKAESLNIHYSAIYQLRRKFIFHRFKKLFFHKIPVVRYFNKWILLLAGLPKFHQNFQRLENFTYAERAESNKLYSNAILNLNKQLFNEKEELSITKKELSRTKEELAIAKEELSVAKEIQSLLRIQVTNIEKRFKPFRDAAPFYEETPSLNIEEMSEYKKKDNSESGIYSNEYSLFENLFRNTDEIQRKQIKYLDYIKDVSKEHAWLDVGCGRGEFLKIISKEGFKVLGLDLNENEIQQLKSEKIDAVQADINSYLSKENIMFSGISALQVVEHLNYDYLKEFLQLASQRIVSGGKIILETINPRNQFAFAGFYMDITHVKPIPPELLVFYLQLYGFEDVRILYMSMLPQDLCSNNPAKDYSDYAVIGRKK